MAEYYCHSCAVKLFMKRPPPTSPLIGSTYQLKKFIKHTVIDSNRDLQSIFSDPSTQIYADYVVNGLVSGSVEIDDLNRQNYIWAAGSHIGFRYEYGIMIKPQDAVRVVLPFYDDKLHVYPENSTNFTYSFCDRCGMAIIR